MSRKFRRNLFKVLAIGMGLFIILSTFLPKTNNDTVDYATGFDNTVYQEEVKNVEEEIYARANIDINKYLLQDRIENANLMVQNVSSDIEYILSTISCKYTASHNSSPEANWNDLLIDSKIDINLDCQVILSIPANKVSITTDKYGVVNVSYDKEDIQVKSINISKYNVVTDKKMLGHKYTNEEVLALIEVAQGKIQSQINNNPSYIDKASANFETYLLQLAKEFQVYAVNFNNQYTQQIKGFEYKEMENVKYGTSGMPLDINNVKYIVVHDTQNFSKSADAEMHYNYLNTNPKALGTHIYVDNDSVVQTMDFNTQMYAVGANENMPNQVVTNENSISVEICVNNYNDEEAMMQTIRNAADTIKALKQSLPNDVQIVTHKDANLKQCPKIFLEGEQCYIMSWEEFLQMTE